MSPYTATCCHRDLYGVSPGPANLLQVEGPVRRLVLPTLNLQRRCIHTHCHEGGPVCVHLSVLMIETLQL
ncbi:hypothetical protein DPMN_133537 [Dreissena polymorpha]|uniref:Uncharacterized protein n=1 Tax=Dreissena polymorpha TaxID=45954 RepID=A0A9D4FUG5_DREPO|nr:hypothetical protein DPMN_133537 [Dreissena polymorpha]